MFHTSFGPWTTSLDSDPRARLSSFWKRRITLLGLARATTASRTSHAAVAAVVLLATAALLLPRVSSTAVADDPPTTSTDTATPDPTANELMRNLYDDEAGLARLDGLLLRLELRQERTDAGIKPAPTIPGVVRSDRLPERSLLIRREFAWDKSRVAMTSETVGFNVDRRTFSNGLAVERHTSLEQGAVTSESFVLDDQVDLIFQHAFDIGMQWGQVERHLGPLTWWRKPYRHERRGQIYEEPTESKIPADLRLVGREVYEGQECYRVEWPRGNDRFYFRASDGRLIGILRLRYSTKLDEDLRIKSAIAGRPFATAAEWEAWLEVQSPAARAVAEAMYAEQHDKRLVLYHEKTFADFRELVPDCCFPFHQRYRSYGTDTGQSVLEVEGNVRVVEATVNPALPDELFAQSIPEGATISTDWRYDPPIRYTYRADQTEQERQALCDKLHAAGEKGRQLLADVRKRIDQRVGQPLPPLPRDRWLNSPALAEGDLRGQAILIAFWDIGCAPCHQTLDLIQTIHANAKLRGQVFIALHRATQDHAAVEKKLAQHGWTMPVLIDGDGGDADHTSLFEWLNVQAMPWIVLIDREGKVAAHGMGGFGSDVYDSFREISQSAAKDSPP